MTFVGIGDWDGGGIGDWDWVVTFAVTFVETFGCDFWFRLLLVTFVCDFWL